jgi:hypothetical protein
VSRCRLRLVRRLLHEDVGSVVSSGDYTCAVTHTVLRSIGDRSACEHIPRDRKVPAQAQASRFWKKRSALTICGYAPHVAVVTAMKKISRASFPAPALGFLVDELRRGGVTTYVDLAAALNRQGLRPAHGRWRAHALYLLMRRHRRAHPQAAIHSGSILYARRADEARKVIRRISRRGLKSRSMIAGALNARGLTTPGLGRPWNARSVSRVLAADPRRKGSRRVRRS